MANQLTHALSAAAAMALINPFIGIEPVSWNIFLAAMIGMLMNLDCGDCRSFQGSPICHSLGCGIFLAYLGFIAAFLAYAFVGWSLIVCMTFALAVAVGIIMHLAAEFFTGQQILTIPRDLNILGWLNKYHGKSERFWSSWGRARLKGNGLKDFHVNGISLALILFSIGFF